VSAPAYFPEPTFVGFDEAQKLATRDVLSSIEEVVGITYTEVSGVGQMTFAMSSQPNGQGGYSYTPSYFYYYSDTTITTVTEQGVAGDVWLNRYAGWDAEDWLPGHNGYITLLHEIGHALGLKHPFESTSSGYTLESSLDNESHTVMSYTMAPHSRLISVSGTAMNYSWQETYLRPSTLMLLDIAALQYLYGANTSTRTGNDVYQWTPNAELLETIWDAGGVDTIDCSNQTLTCLIDLRGGSYSSIALRQTDAELRLGLDLPSWFAQALPADIYSGSNNLAIATGAVIEIAIGGTGNDQITGNDANNTLKGGGGADSISGGLGQDTLDGGSGIDTMTGGDGSDYYYVRDGGDLVKETNAVAATGGTDLVYSYLSTYTLGTNVENGRIVTTAAANLTGNPLNNLLYAGAGNNSLNGSTGTDTVSYAYGLSGTTGVTVSLALATAQVTGGSGTDTLISIENLTGSNYADKLTGTSGANSLSGLAGNDTLDGGSGIDTTGSGDHEVKAGQDRVRVERGEQHRRARCAAAVGIVVEISGGGVVDQVVIGVRRADDPGTRAERGGRQRAERRQRGEDGVLELDSVVDDVEVGDRVSVGAGIEQRVEANDVASQPTAQGVVGQAAIEQVVAETTLPELPVACTVLTARLTVTPVVPITL
jgi:Ca2+-binding RTX toxin-like protein